MTYCPLKHILWELPRSPEHNIKDTTEINTSASYLYLLHSIGRDGKLCTSFYDKRDDFNVHITTFLFWVATPHIRPFENGVFASQLILCTKYCPSYQHFFFRGRCDFPISFSDREGYVKECLKSSIRKWYSFYGDLIKQDKPPSPFRNVTWHSGGWPYTLTLSIDKTLHAFVDLLLNWTL